MGDLEDAFKGVGRGVQSIATFGGLLPDPIGDKIFGKSISNAVAAFAAQQPAAAEPPKTLITPGDMPTPNSSDQRKAKRKSLAEQLARKGRASTIMTAAENDTLGAG